MYKAYQRSFGSTSRTNEELDCAIAKCIAPETYEISGYRESLISSICSDDAGLGRVLERLNTEEYRKEEKYRSLRKDIINFGIDTIAARVAISIELTQWGSHKDEKLGEYLCANPNASRNYFANIARNGADEQTILFWCKADQNCSNIGIALRQAAYNNPDAAGLFCKIGACGMENPQKPTSCARHLAIAVAQNVVSLDDIEASLEQYEMSFEQIDLVVSQITQLTSDFRYVWNSGFFNYVYNQSKRQTGIDVTSDLISTKLLNERIEEESKVSIYSPQQTKAIGAALFDKAYNSKLANSKDAYQAEEALFAFVQEYSDLRFKSLAEVIDLLWCGSENEVNSLTTQFLYAEDNCGNFQLGRELRRSLLNQEAKPHALRTMLAVYLFDQTQSAEGIPTSTISRELLAAIKLNEVSQREILNELQSITTPDSAHYHATLLQERVKKVLSTGSLLPSEILNGVGLHKSNITQFEERIGTSVIGAANVVHRELGIVLDESEVFTLSRGMQQLYSSNCRGRIDLFCRFGEPLLHPKEIEKSLHNTGGFNSKDKLEVLILAILLNHIAPRIPAEMKTDYQSLCALILARRGQEVDRFASWREIIKHPAELDTSRGILDLTRLPEISPWVAIAQSEKRMSEAIGEKRSVLKSYYAIKNLLTVAPPAQWQSTLNNIHRNLLKANNGEKTIRNLVKIAFIDPSKPEEILDIGLATIRSYAGKDVFDKAISLVARIAHRSGKNAFDLIDQGLPSIGNTIAEFQSLEVLESIDKLSQIYSEETSNLIVNVVSPMIRIDSVVRKFGDDKKKIVLGAIDCLIGHRDITGLEDIVKKGVLPCIAASTSNSRSITSNDEMILLFRLGLQFGIRGIEALRNDVSWILGQSGINVSEVVSYLEANFTNRPESTIAALNTTRIYFEISGIQPSWDSYINILSEFTNVAEVCGCEFLWTTFESSFRGITPPPGYNGILRLATLAQNSPADSREIFAEHLPFIAQGMGASGFNTSLESIADLLSPSVGLTSSTIKKVFYPIFNIYKNSLTRESFNVLQSWVVQRGDVAVNKAAHGLLKCMHEHGVNNSPDVLQNIIGVASQFEDASIVLEEELLMCIRQFNGKFTAEDYESISAILTLPYAVANRFGSDGLASVLSELGDSISVDQWGALNEIFTQYPNNAIDILWCALRPIAARSAVPLSSVQIKTIANKVNSLLEAYQIDPKFLSEKILLPRAHESTYESFLSSIDETRSRLQNLHGMLGAATRINNYALANAFNVQS
jgi:hypothetical protein